MGFNNEKEQQKILKMIQKYFDKKKNKDMRGRQRLSTLCWA